MRIQDVDSGNNFNPIPGLYLIPLLELEATLRMAAVGDRELAPRLPQLFQDMRLCNIFATSLLARPPSLPPGVHTEPLTHKEIVVIRLYTCPALYSILNARLRTVERSVLQPYLPLLKLLLTALYKLPRVNGPIYRAVPTDLRADFTTDETKVWWAFSSCTKELAVLDDPGFGGSTGQRTFFWIQASAAFDVSRYSAYAHEKEVILAPGATLKVTGGHSPAPNIHNITMVQEPFVELHLEEDSVSDRVWCVCMIYDFLY